MTYRGNDGSSEEERAAEVPVAGVIGRVSNGTHSSTDRIHCMLGKHVHTENDSDRHFGSASLTVTILANHFIKPFFLSHPAQCQTLQECHISQSNSQEC